MEDLLSVLVFEGTTLSYHSCLMCFLRKIHFYQDRTSYPCFQSESRKLLSKCLGTYLFVFFILMHFTPILFDIKFVFWLIKNSRFSRMRGPPVDEKKGQKVRECMNVQERKAGIVHPEPFRSVKISRVLYVASALTIITQRESFCSKKCRWGWGCEVFPNQTFSGTLLLTLWPLLLENYSGKSWTGKRARAVL